MPTANAEHRLEFEARGWDRAKRIDRRATAAAVVIGGFALLIGLEGEPEFSESTAAVDAAPSQLAFLNQPSDSSSAPQFVSLSNSGGSPVPVGSVAISNAAFSAALRNCADSAVPARGGCVVEVVFRPVSGRDQTGQLRLEGLGKVVELRGTVTRPQVVQGPPAPVPPGPVAQPQPVPQPSPKAPPPPPRAAWVPRKFDFGRLPPGETRSFTLQLVNTGTAPLSAVQVRPGEPRPEFTFDASACRSLRAGASCPVEVLFAPGQDGDFGTSLVASIGTVVLDRSWVAGSAQTPPRPKAAVSPNILEFTSRAQVLPFVIHNAGRADLDLTSFVVDNQTDFRLKEPVCPNRRLHPGEFCRVEVLYQGRKPAQGVVRVEHSAGADSVALAGNLPQEKKHSWVKGLIAAGVIAGVAAGVAANQGGSEAAPQTNPNTRQQPPVMTHVPAGATATGATGVRQKKPPPPPPIR